MGIFRNIIGSKNEVVSVIDSAEVSLAKKMEAERVEAERDKSILESVTSCVMAVDENNIIVKVNSSTLEMMRAAEKDIRRELPDFSAAKLVGSSMDIFHRNPAHQRSMPKSLSSTYQSQIKVGARTFELTANPIIGDSGTRLGTVVEWEDISDKLSIEKLALAKAEQGKILAAGNARIKAALDCVTSNVMLADENNIIVKVNSSTLEMMRAAEKDIRRELPDFSAAKLVGSSMDILHKNPAHQRSLLESLSSTHQSQINVGTRTFRLTANPIISDSATRLGTVIEWEDISDKLSIEKLALAKAEQGKVLAAGNARIKAALDCVTSNVMLADANNIIVYANDAVTQMLQNAEPDIKKELPHFEARNILGNSMDIFHEKPEHHIALLAKLNKVFRTSIKVGGRTFSLIASPVFDDQGKRLATVIEWNDRTKELQTEENLKSTVNKTIVAAINGDLGARIEITDQEGAVDQICKSINNLLEVFESVTDDISESVTALASGDLTRKIEKNYPGAFDLLRANVNSTIVKLVDVVTEIRESANSVNTGSTEISSGNQHLSQRTEAQAASLEETSAAMEEITTTVQQNAANSVQANSLARGARETAENGGAVVGTAISAMEAISESSAKINDIIGVIDEIAFQTNLLALNAAVEAARAGDQGRGFAVVADEVRSLAGRSAKAAKEIKELIKDSSVKVKEGSGLVNKSGETLKEIVTAVKKVNDVVVEISTASDEQASGLDEINKAMGEMDEMTQQNAALVEQAAAASESLGDQAENLDRLISFFNTGVERAPQARAAAPSAPARAKKEAAPAKPRSEKTDSNEYPDWSEF